MVSVFFFGIEKLYSFSHFSYEIVSKGLTLAAITISRSGHLASDTKSSHLEMFRYEVSLSVGFQYLYFIEMPAL